MLAVLRWIFRLGGVYPRGTDSDNCFTFVPLFLFLKLLGTTIMYKVVSGDFSLTIAGFNVINDMILCSAGLFFVIKANESKKYLKDLLRKCWVTNRNCGVSLTELTLLVTIRHLSSRFSALNTRLKKVCKAIREETSPLPVLRADLTSVF